MQGTGFFRLLLPAGTYALHAESIDSSFTGGSAVGPYASSSNDISFKPPHPITPVALGGASPQQVANTPGCVATATFRLNGSGSVSGNCRSAPKSPAATTTTFASSANPAAVGALVTLTATLAGTTPTGTVSFKDSGTTVAGCAGVSLAAAGTAACNTSALVAGVHSIVAAYGGDAANASLSSAALSQVVNAAAQTNVLTNGVPATGLSGSTNTELRYTLSVPAGATTLSFRTTGGSGNANLFVKFGSPQRPQRTAAVRARPAPRRAAGSCFPEPAPVTSSCAARPVAGVTLTATFK